METKVTEVKSVQMNNTSTIKCSTINEELEALFSAIDREISDNPEAALEFA